MGSINATEIIGLVAALLTTSGFIPQVLKTWKTKDVSSLSLPMYLVLFVGMLLWLAYGIINESIALILANIASAMLTLLIMIFILVYKK